MQYQVLSVSLGYVLSIPDERSGGLSGISRSAAYKSE